MIDVLSTFWPTLALIGGITALFLLLRRRPTPAERRTPRLDAGRPTIVHIYSNV